jgi:hypothetical protein
MVANSSAIDAAIVSVLAGDPELAGLVPDGVWIDEAPPGAQRFVIVAQADANDIGTFDGRAYEDKLFTIVSKMLSTAGGNSNRAAARIDELLEDAPLTVDGYGWMTMYRERPIRETDTDDLDPSLRWFHRGGEYRVQMALEPSAQRIQP